MAVEMNPDDLRVAQVMRLSIAELEWDPERAAAMSEERMRKAVAHFIATERVETIVGEHYVEKRIDLYVATPAQFWEVVHKEAQAIALRYAPRKYE